MTRPLRVFFRTLAVIVMSVPLLASGTTSSADKKELDVEPFKQPVAVHTDARTMASEADCSRTKNALHQKAKIAGKSQVGLCVDRTPPSQDAIKKMERNLRSTAIPSFPSWCFDRTTLDWYYTRTIGCRTWLWFRPTVYRVEANGTVTYVGSVQIRAIQAASTATGVGATTWDHWTAIQVMSVNGDVAGMTVHGSSVCRPYDSSVSGCSQLPTSTFPAQSISNLADQAEGYFVFEATGIATGAKAYSNSEILLHFAKPGAQRIDGPASMWQTDWNRCDDALPGRSRGCVFFRYRPTYAVSLTGPISLYAAHLRDALASGLPGAPGGTPLTRLTDATLRGRNGDRACPGRYPRPQQPVVHQCDEYPFRSTWQGAYTANPGYPSDPTQPWPARTHDWCQIFQEPSGVTGPDGYSVCMIPATQNGDGGNDLLAFYNANRIIEKDAFFVTTY